MADGEVAADLTEKLLGLSAGGKEEPQLPATGNERRHPDGGKVREEPRLSKKKDEKRKKLEKKFETLAPSRKPSETHYKSLFAKPATATFSLRRCMQKSATTISFQMIWVNKEDLLRKLFWLNR